MYFLKTSHFHWFLLDRNSLVLTIGCSSVKFNSAFYLGFANNRSWKTFYENNDKYFHLDRLIDLCGSLKKQSMSKCAFFPRYVTKKGDDGIQCTV